MCCTMGVHTEALSASLGVATGPKTMPGHMVASSQLCTHTSTRTHTRTRTVQGTATRTCTAGTHIYQGMCINGVGDSLTRAFVAVPGMDCHPADAGCFLRSCRICQASFAAGWPTAPVSLPCCGTAALLCLLANCRGSRELWCKGATGQHGLLLLWLHGWVPRTNRHAPHSGRGLQRLHLPGHACPSTGSAHLLPRAIWYASRSLSLLQ